MEIAQFPQRSFGRLLFESVPAIKGASSRQQSFEFSISAFLAENVPNFLEVIRQEFACKVQDHRPAEIEVLFVGDRDVLRSVLVSPVCLYRKA
jgi:hypothetical protein